MIPSNKRCFSVCGFLNTCAPGVVHYLGCSQGSLPTQPSPITGLCGPEGCAQMQYTLWAWCWALHRQVPGRQSTPQAKSTFAFFSPSCCATLAMSLAKHRVCPLVEQFWGSLISEKGFGLHLYPHVPRQPWQSWNYGPNQASPAQAREAGSADMHLLPMVWF